MQRSNEQPMVWLDYIDPMIAHAASRGGDMEKQSYAWALRLLRPAWQFAKGLFGRRAAGAAAREVAKKAPVTAAKQAPTWGARHPWLKKGLEIGGTGAVFSAVGAGMDSLFGGGGGDQAGDPQAGYPGMAGMDGGASGANMSAIIKPQEDLTRYGFSGNAGSHFGNMGKSAAFIPVVSRLASRLLGRGATRALPINAAVRGASTVARPIMQKALSPGVMWPALGVAGLATAYDVRQRRQAAEDKGVQDYVDALYKNPPLDTSHLSQYSPAPPRY